MISIKNELQKADIQNDSIFTHSTEFNAAVENDVIDKYRNIGIQEKSISDNVEKLIINKPQIITKVVKARKINREIPDEGVQAAR